MEKFTQKDEFFMEKALALAEKGEGKVAPNPLVGAVLVKNGKIIGQGYHQKFGGPHAEINALKNCRKNPRGSILYLNLEPCSHQGKTPPCVPVLIQAGVSEVILAMKDLNPLVNGRGIRMLKKAGIKVKIGLLKEQAQKLNEIFIKYVTTGMPFVALKTAMSLDGKIATCTGESKWITGEKSRRYVQKLRNKYDAVLLGINTVLKDNPNLGVRGIKGRDPLRIILDPQLRIPLTAQVLRDKNVLIVMAQSCNQAKLQKLQALGFPVLLMNYSEQNPLAPLNKKFILKTLLGKLARRKIFSILVEGGSKTNATFLEEKLGDKVYFFIAPLLIGGNQAPSPWGGKGVSKITQAYHLKNWTIEKFDPDFLITGYL